MATPTHKAVTHNLRIDLVVRLARIAYKEGISRSAVIEHAVDALFRIHAKDATLGVALRESGARLRRPKRG